MVTEVVAVQLLASVAATVYVPADRPVVVAEVEPVLQTKVFVPVPPVADVVALPLLPPKQVLTLLWLVLTTT